MRFPNRFDLDVADLLVVTLVAVVTAAMNSAAFAAPGDLDATFGSGGIAGHGTVTGKAGDGGSWLQEGDSPARSTSSISTNRDGLFLVAIAVPSRRPAGLPHHSSSPRR